MKFSVIITTYNRLPLLQRAIKSALTQTVPCEVVVADDASSDGTEAYVTSLVEALRAVGDERLVYHRNAANLGHSATVNAGVNVAKGDWIKFLDDDDYLDPNCIEEMARGIALHPQAVICSCQAAQVDANEVELSRTRQISTSRAFYIPQEDIHYGMLLELVPFGTPAQVACHRDTFLKTGGWNSCLDTNCDDIDFWIRVAQFGDAIFLNRCLAYRTIWPGAYNQKISLQQRMNNNLLVKQKIHALVSERHRAALPTIAAIRDYLKLHWSFVALKQRKILSAVKIGSSAVFSLHAWRLLNSAIRSRQEGDKDNCVRKIVLLEATATPQAHTNYITRLDAVKASFSSM